MMSRIPTLRLAASKIQPYGQTITGSPDTSGPLRRARQTLAGTPTAIRTRPVNVGRIKKVGIGRI